MSFLQKRVVGFHLARQPLSEGGLVARPWPGLIILYQRSGKYLDMFVCALSNKADCGHRFCGHGNRLFLDAAISVDA
jgi:hypothetical protein